MNGQLHYKEQDQETSYPLLRNSNGGVLCIISSSKDLPVVVYKK